MRRWASILTLAIGAGLLTGEIDQQEFECEEAVAHLQECCDADFSSVGCGAGCDDVDIDIQNAYCLRTSSCDEIRASGACKSHTVPSCR